MPEQHEEGHEAEPQINDLPSEAVEQIADSVKGGAARRGGDDDLEDLEVERRK